MPNQLDIDRTLFESRIQQDQAAIRDRPGCEAIRQGGDVIGYAEYGRNRSEVRYRQRDARRRIATVPRLLQQTLHTHSPQHPAFFRKTIPVLRSSARKINNELWKIEEALQRRRLFCQRVAGPYHECSGLTNKKFTPERTGQSVEPPHDNVDSLRLELTCHVSPICRRYLEINERRGQSEALHQVWQRE